MTFTTNIHKIPTSAWVYLFKDKKGNILYIGKAKNLQKRVSQYFAPNSLRKQEMLNKAATLDFLIVNNESEALYLEDNLIKQHQPEYNNLLKADNSYTYIKITHEQFPQILLTKRKIHDGATYIGPKRDSIQLKKFLQYMRQINKYRWCKTTQFKQAKVCSDYYFGLCQGRCKMTNEREAQNAYKDILHTITSFFQGNTTPITQEIHKQIQQASEQQNFEWAAQLRDIYLSLQWFVEKQDVVLNKNQDGYLALIKTIGTQYLYTVLVFAQGKLIDVITSKQQTSDIDADSLEMAIKRTFWEGESQKDGPERRIIWLSKKINKKIAIEKDEKILKPLRILAQNFLESYIITQTLQEDTQLINEIFQTLKTRYHLKNIPYRIECIDISHIQWGRASGGISCIQEWLPYKPWYRKYKLTTKTGDDYAALQEVLSRRIKNKENMPSCFLIDGGKGQLQSIKKIVESDKQRKELFQNIDIISLGKGEARKKSNIWTTKVKKNKTHQIGEKIYYFDQQMHIKHQDMVYDQADKIFLKTRDEAHRFANKYRKEQMSKDRK